MSVTPFPLKEYAHPAGVFRVEYPAHWDLVQKDEERSVGFGPHDRDDVGLWITIMPMSVDTDSLITELPRLMTQSMPEFEAGEVRRDSTLRHYGLKADITKDGQGGHYWIVTGGDVILFASSQVPAAERDVWNPPLEQLMASLQITRDDELFMRKLANEVLDVLRERHPEQDFQHDERGIRGKNRVVYLTNLYREVRGAPARRAEIIKHFVETMAQAGDVKMGDEPWDEARAHILPVLKPKAYIDPEGPTRNLITTEWLADVIICYAINSQKFFRFVIGGDLERWGITPPALHQTALENLALLPWPSKMEGSRMHEGGRVIVVATNDSMASSRLLHPDLHKLFSGPLGSPFLAGIPDRGALILYSNRRHLKQRIARQLRKDHRTASYPITARPFLVTPDGIAAARE